MKKLLVFILLLTAFKSILHGQPVGTITLPKPSIPSANATALGLYGAFPVSYSNGTADISIPLYEIKTSRLSLPISINCHTNGIKVHEQASVVGLGWSLSAGGAIVRQINDLADFDPDGYSHRTIPAGVRQSSFPYPYVMDQMNDEQRYYYGRVSGFHVRKNQGVQKVDGQPDDFFYNIGGKSGRFILKTTIDSAIAPRFMTIPYDPIQIQYDQQYTAGNDRFTIRDANGITYIFGRSIKDNSVAVETSETDNGSDITSWFLTEMISADRTDTISFKYEDQLSNISTMNYRSNSIAVHYGRGNSSATIDQYGRPIPIWQSTGPGYSEVRSNSLVTNKNINLSEIYFKNGKVKFDYSSRDDLGGFRLVKVTIYQLSGGQYAASKRLNLNQSYFTAANTLSQVGVGDRGTVRLRLDSITEEGLYRKDIPTPSRSYTFDYYYYNTGFPSATYKGAIANLGEYGQDLWGYWNGRQNSNLIVAPSNEPRLISAFAVNPLGRVPDSTYMIAGTIKSIQYPTGGTTEFQYEPNKTRRKYITSDTTFKAYHLSNILGAYKTDQTDINFTATDSIEATLQFTATLTCNTCNSVEPRVYLEDLTTGSPGMPFLRLGNVSQSSGESKFTEKVKLIKGHIYHLYLPPPSFYQSGSSSNFHLDASFSHVGILSVTETPHDELVMTGGLRVKKVISRNRDTKTLMIKRYVYKTPYYISDIFTGDFAKTGDGYAYMKYQGIPGIGVYGFTPDLLPLAKTYTENFTISLGGATNGALAYQEVEEYQEDTDGRALGKNTYNFNLVKDYAPDNFSTTRINNAWRRAQLLEQKTYKSNGNDYDLVRSTKNTYADIFPNLQDTTLSVSVKRTFSLDDLMNTSPSGPNTIEPSGPGNTNNPPTWAAFDGWEFSTPINRDYNSNYVNLWNLYYVSVLKEINYRSVITSTTITDYNTNGGGPVVTTVNNFYSNPEHLKLTRSETSKSDKNKLISKTIYNSDYKIDNCNPDNAINMLRTSLANLKTDFDAQSSPLYDKWFNYVAGRTFSIVHCNSESGCVRSSGALNNDQEIINLYKQFGNMKSAYLRKVKDAVTIYKQNVAGYNSCLITQLSNSTDSVRSLLQMQQNNQIEPVESYTTYVDTVSRAEYLIKASRVYYKTTGNMVKPARVYLGGFKNKTLFNTFKNEPFKYLWTDINYQAYDVNGNLITYNKEAGPPVTVIWGYKGQHPIAQVKNAKRNDVFFESFEEGNGNSAMEDARTGHYSRTSAYFKELSGLSGGVYTLSYWSKSGSSWTQTVSDINITGNSYTINLSGQVDDVRIYPKDAQMTTYTYDPLVGMTSQTNARGETTTYEYDEFQRLKTIRDSKGQIVKQMDYHYQNQ